MAEDDLRTLTGRLAQAVLSSRSEPRPLRLDDEVCESFFRHLAGHQLEGVAAAAADAGALIISAEQRARLQLAARDAMSWAVTIERRLLEIAERFDHAKIDFIVMKGPAMAHTAYADPSHRPFRDLDLLVRARDWARASETLVGMGFERERPEPRAGFDVRFGKAAVHTDGAGVPVDLHRRLVLGPFGMWIDAEALFDRVAPLNLAGYELRRLDDTGLLLHSCVHAALGWRPPLPLTLWDVAQAARLEGVDWNELRELSRRWRLDAVLRFAFRAVLAPGFGADLPAETAVFEHADPGKREMRALAAYVTERRRFGSMSLATARALPGVRERVRYAATLLLPSRAFMAWRGRSGGEASYLRRWAMPLSWLRRRASKRDRRAHSARVDPGTHGARVEISGRNG